MANGVTVLHAGCGGDPLPAWFGPHTETRLDIDPACSPDVVADLRALGDIGPFGMVYCSHALEHLTAADAATALREFARVLAPGGVVMVVVPDLSDIRPTLDPVYENELGAITGLDMFYGLQSMVRDNPYMQHLTGFVPATLEQALTAAGFADVSTRVDRFNLYGIGKKCQS